MKLISSAKKCLGEEGIYLDKNIHIRMSLRKGKDTHKSLGAFEVDMQGDCQLARKMLLYAGIVCVTLILCYCMKTKNNQK